MPTVDRRHPETWTVARWTPCAALAAFAIATPCLAQQAPSASEEVFFYNGRRKP